MPEDQNNDSANNQQGNQGGDSGNQQAQPLTINAELLGEFKDDPVFKPFADKPIGEVFKSFKNAQSMIGGEKIPLPAGKLDTPENWNYIFDKLGRPKSADGYKLEKPELPQGMSWSEETEKAYKSLFHYLGLLPWQAQGLFQLDTKMKIEQFNAATQADNSKAEEITNNLIKELGTKEKYDEYVTGAKAALNRFGGDPTEIGAFIDKFGNDPLVVKVFGNVAKNMMEDAALRGDTTFDLLGGNAKSMVDDIMGNKQNKYYEAYWKADHPLHQTAVDEVTRLLSILHPDTKE